MTTRKSGTLTATKYLASSRSVFAASVHVRRCGGEGREDDQGHCEEDGRDEPAPAVEPRDDVHLVVVV
jgi:hypothetical protein